MIGCTCGVCTSTDPRDKRLRTSALVRVKPCGSGPGDRLGGSAAGCGPGSCGVDVDDPGSGDFRTNDNDPGSGPGDCGGTEPLNIVIDAGPDFRAQMLTAGVMRLDAILLTHEHKDHTGGIDDVRAYNYFSHTPVDIWATERVQRAVRKDYDYAFAVPSYPGAPEITLHTIPEGSRGADGTPRDDSFDVKGVRVTPIHGLHMKLPVTGFRIGGMAYLTDFNHLDDGELEKLRGIDTLVVNAIGHIKHISHFNLEEAIELGRKVGARQTFLTHMAHRIGRHADLQPTLPEGVFVAYDGLCIEVGDGERHSSGCTGGQPDGADKLSI